MCFQLPAVIPPPSHKALPFQFRPLFAVGQAAADSHRLFSLLPNVLCEIMAVLLSFSNAIPVCNTTESALVGSISYSQRNPATNLSDPVEQKRPEEEKTGEDQKDQAKEEPNQEAAEDGKEEEAPKKAEEEAGESGSEDKKDAPPAPPPEEVVMKVYMHCDGCARKVHRCLKAAEGVEDVVIECRTHSVVVKGKAAAADPMKLVERLQKKTGRKVELLTPIPPKPEPPKEEDKKEEEKPKPKEEKKDEAKKIKVVIKVHMHCEPCSLEIKRRIFRMKGVESVETDVKASQVEVRGAIDPAKLVEHIYRRTGRHAVVVKQEEEVAEGEKKEDEGKEGGGGEEGKKEGGGGDQEAEKEDGGGGEESAAAAAEMKRSELYYNYHQYYPKYGVEYAYPAPQIFSDENPNACSVM